MKYIYCLALIVVANITIVNAQNVGVNSTGATPAPSAMLDVVSTNRGALMPRVALTSTTDVVTIASPATSLLVYNTATASTGATAVAPGYYYFDGAKWTSFGGSGGKDWSLLGNSGTAAGTNFIGTTDAQDLVFKTNGAENMRILNSNGNVGVGTNTPQEKFNVAFGNLQVGEPLAINTTGRRLYFGQSSANDVVYFYRQNYAADVTELNLAIGDNYRVGASTLNDDKFNIGSTDFSNVYPGFNYAFTVNATVSKVGINNYNPANTLEVTQGTAGNSGLRLTNLPNSVLLSTNASGDVVSATVAPANGLFWGLTGNIGTNAATNFMGTTDNNDVVFKRNNIRSGLLNATNTGWGFNTLIASTGFQNVALGAYSMASAVGASSNVAIGYQALNLNVANNNNTAVGINALRKTTANNNTGIGSNALENTTTGGNNTAVGFQALFTNTTGDYNTAVGHNALTFSTIGAENTAIGRGALGANTTGSGNIALGPYSMDKNTIGAYNTAIGYNVMQYGVAGNNAVAIGNGAMKFSNNTATTYDNTNIAVGYQALRGVAIPASNTGLNNTVVGYEAMLNNASGGQNSAFGFNTLYANVTGIDNTAMGFQALALNQTGNGNTAVGRQALYTNSAGNNNTATGYGALNFSTSSNNTASGYFALNKNVGGSLNTAIGSKALEINVAGNANTAVGYQALYANGQGSVTSSQGTGNTAVGINASSDNRLGTSNTAIGAYSLVKNTVSGNTAVGYNALNANSTGTGNVGVGKDALLLNATSNDNTAIGEGALQRTTAGGFNTAVGKVALQNNTTGFDNVAFGEFTAQILTTGNENTIIGTDSDVGAGNISNSSTLGNNCRVNGNNATALGDNSIATAASMVRIGNTTVTSINGQVAYSVVSDGRFKTVTNNEVKGLEFITKLRPVTYTFDTKKYDEFLVKNLTEDLRKKHLSKHDYTESSAIVHTGFIAQEVEIAAKEANFNFDAVHAPVNDNDNYSVAYSQFVVPIVKSIQELNNKVNDNQNTSLFTQQLKLQQEQINLLLKQNNELMNRLKLLENK